MFKSKANIKTSRSTEQLVWKTKKQIIGLLGKKDAKNYINSMIKAKRVTEKDGVTKYGWRNDVREEVIEAVQEKELNLASENACQSPSAPSSSSVHKVQDILELVGQLPVSDIQVLQKGFADYLRIGSK